MTMDELDQRQTPTKHVPAWQLREKMKQEGPRRTAPVKPKTTPTEDDLAALPPAFRAAAKARKKKKGMDDFDSLDSVHSSKSAYSAYSGVLTATPTTPASDASSFHDSDSSFDGHDSFASLGEDEEDDEAYREGQNQMNRQEVDDTRKKTSLRSQLAKKDPFQGTPLDFIAE